MITHLVLVHLLALESAMLGSAVPSEPVALPGALEIELARSALPPHLRADATIHVYHADCGFEVAVEGSNGFHALVGRDDPGIKLAPWTYERWADDLLIPIAFDEAGADMLQTYLDLGSMRAEGIEPTEAQRRLREGFANGRYQPPARAGVSYMLSPLLRAYRSTEVDDRVGTFVLPHYMFYAPGMTNADIGGDPQRRHPFVQHHTPDPHGVVILRAGERERKQIRAEHADLLARLCELHEAWCVAAD